MAESRDHARLGPSAAHRWIHCPASVRLVESLESSGVETDTGSVYAAEGTAAHTIAEILASHRYGKITDVMMDAAFAAWRGSNDGADWIGEGQTIQSMLDEMIEHATTYTEVIGEHREPGDEMYLELKVDTGVESVWGTGDCVLIGRNRVTIIDYKYGTGVRVDAPGNEQLMFYALGALEADLIGTATVIRMVVCQPRLDHVSYWEIGVAELIEWRDTVAAPAAELALSGSAPFGPSVSACQFCPARGRCKAQMVWIAERDFPEPDLMEPEDFAEALRIAPMIRQWTRDVEEKALQITYGDGEKIPGWKVVLSGGQRKITDETKAIETLVAAGYPREKVERTQVGIQTLGELDKVVKVGKTKVLKSVLGDLLADPVGKPALVPEGDSRPEHVKEDSAAADFADTEGED